MNDYIKMEVRSSMFVVFSAVGGGKVKDGIFY